MRVFPFKHVVHEFLLHHSRYLSNSKVPGVYNQLTGAIPCQISLLTKLKVLYVPRNCFESVLACLIGAGNTSIDGWLQDSLLLLKKFVFFRDLSNNKVGGTVPAQISVLTALNQL